MKLRINRNALRLRLTRPEVEEFATAGRFEESIEFLPGETLTYCLEKTSDVQTTARFDSGRVTVAVPAAAGDIWANGDEVGIEAEQRLNDGSGLRILIEKDFACLKPREGEDGEDHYPHPATGAAC